MSLIKEITLPWPAPELRSNARCHWAKKARMTADARAHACAVSMSRPRIACLPDAQIFIEYYPPTKRGDIHNVPSSLKAYIDGCLRAAKFCASTASCAA